MQQQQKLRHPEKAGRPDSPILRKPPWLRVKAPTSAGYRETLRIVRDAQLNTVCEEAACPNIGECWENRHATFMIMGEVCTRACAFCNVTTGKPSALDLGEPARIGVAVRKLSLEHVVVTSVDRDDLADGGADHFAAVINAIRKQAPDTTIEVLVPDFMHKGDAVNTVLAATPDVFNHNIETVPKLYPSIRPGSRYFTSLHLLKSAKEAAPAGFTKSGLMVGLGETREEVLQVMDDLREAEVDFLTIGQYLQPTRKHAPIDRFVTPEEFDGLAKHARSKGFSMVSASPLTRSSYFAAEDFATLKRNRKKEWAGMAATPS